MKSSWIYYLLVLLVVEKITQHAVVTVAFYFDSKGIASTVVVSSTALMISGAFVGVLFAVDLWAMIPKEPGHSSWLSLWRSSISSANLWRRED